MRIFNKKEEPEKFSCIDSLLYNMFPAKVWMPQYRSIAQSLPLASGKVLDIGTGPGYLPLEIAKRTKAMQITGIDLSRTIIGIANINKLIRNAGNVIFRVGDGNKLDFEDSSFDLIISTNTLHHWRKPLQVLAEIYRCLKKGCRAWIFDGYSDASLEEVKNNVAKILGLFPPPYYFRKNILARHGFSKEEYQNKIGKIISQSPFRAAGFAQAGVLMRIELLK